MSGYIIKKALPSELILGQSRESLFLLIFTLIGIALISLSLLTKLKLVNPPASFFSMFLGMGIIFTAGSLVFTIRKIPDTISFDKDASAVVFSENGLKYSQPFSAFSRLLLTGKITKSQNSSTMTYQLEMVSHSGSSLLLCESGDKAALQKTAEIIISYIDIDFLSGGELLHKGNRIYEDSGYMFPGRDTISISAVPGPEGTVYKWNSRKSLASVFLLGIIIFGFNYLLFAWAFPAMGRYNIGSYAGGAILVIIDIFFTATLVFNLLGTNIAEVTGTAFKFRQSIFGFNLNSREFSRNEIALVSSGFTSDDNKITVFTKRGLDLSNEMKIFAVLNNLNDKSVLMSLIPKVMELQKNIIEIDGSPLYYYEKLYLEKEWSDKLKLVE